MVVLGNNGIYYSYFIALNEEETFQFSLLSQTLKFV